MAVPRGSPLAWMTASSFGFAVMAALVRLLSAQLGQYWLVLLRAGITALVFLAVLLLYTD